ncbi:tektin-B1 [Drosophila mojavensis]|uniref:Tektin n=1 Tax=Drosophila mojavensis TaxID=7230 RepID=B4KSL8_DROMO|nr:tektin-B1 [Drosophila mojavensis]EDW10517.1 uncharacterized protein Dmoj_GI18503 [Drosophila mojavensis]
MSFKSVVTMEKPLAHISLADWKYRVGCLSRVANARLADTAVIRRTSRILQNETQIEQKWATHDSNQAMAERIAELDNWYAIISRSAERIDNEIKLLQMEKTLTERELDALAEPIAVISDMISSRDSRLGSEMTYDEPDTEIKNELIIMENNQELLAKCCKTAWEKMNVLADVRTKINIELEDKTEAALLDKAQRELDSNSTYISHKPDPRRLPKNFYSYQSWLDHTKSIKRMAENELADTTAMRESLFVCRQKAITLLQAQQERTEFIIRKRIFETQQARNELDFQLTKMKDGMQAALKDIEELENSLQEKTNSLKLAETRLENRAQRRNAELCLDTPYDVLCVEVEKQLEIRRCLQEKMDETRANFNLLGQHTQKITVDLEKKDHALMTDKRTLAIRQAFKDRQKGTDVINPCAQTDYNIQITNTQDIIPKT